MVITNETIVNTVKMDDLNNSDKLIYLLLLLYSDDNGVNKLTNKQLNELTGFVAITINKSLENLESVGRITRNFDINKNVPGHMERTITIK